MQGKLIGINTGYIFSRTGGQRGIGFAIPAALRPISSDSSGRRPVVRGWMVWPFRKLPGLANPSSCPSSARASLISDVNVRMRRPIRGMRRGDVVISPSIKAESQQITGTWSRRGVGKDADIKILREGEDRC